MRVRAADLNGECPLAVYDSKGRFALDIDFSRPPEEIADALEGLFQEAVDTGRWTRRGTGAHEQAPDTTRQEAAPHPENGLH